MPKLSIIIPCKNEEEQLPKLLASIKRQTFTDYEIIVADAHSKDRTREIAESFGARVVEGGMPGPGRNKGALQAQGTHLLFLDADVTLLSDRYLEDVLKEFEEKRADVATGPIIPQSDKYLDHVFHGFYNAFIKLTESIRPHAPGMCILTKRHMHEGVQGFDEEVVFAEDMEYVQRAVKRGNRFKVLRSQPISASVRRFDKDGRWGIAIKYVYGELRMIVKGPFRKQPFRYDMGGTEKKDKHDS